METAGVPFGASGDIGTAAAGSGGRRLFKLELSFGVACGVERIDALGRLSLQGVLALIVRRYV